MTLTEWFPNSGHTAATLAAALECDVSTVNELLRGRRWPSLNIALRLDTLSHGLVCRWDARFHADNQRIPAAKVSSRSRRAVA